MPLAGQLPIFGAASADPAPTDLAGLLIGTGQLVRMGGTARVSVVVTQAWRVHVLVAEMAARRLAPTWEQVLDESHFTVRTAYTGILAPLGAAWLRGAVKAPPPNFALDGVRLRLWFVAAGSLNPDDSEIIMRLGANDENCHGPARRALRQLGIDSEQVKGPALRISGRRRVRRFGELIGDHPHAAAPWPA